MQVRAITLVAVALTAALAALPAQAQSVRVKCELRSDRSTASVDGSGLGAGQYHAAVVSGGQTVTSPNQPAVAGESEFDFSSQPRDIRKGATAIPADFLASGQVTGKLYTAAGQLVTTKTVACRVR